MPPKEIYVPPKPQVVVIDGQTVTANIDRRIFNYESQDINSGDMFFGQPGGLLDNSNEQHPYIEFLYEKLRGLDWNEREFDFTQCNLEFKRMNRDDPTLAKPMINQLGFQWETDTVAARLVSLIMGCFTTHETTANLYQRIGDNEVVHARTYKEIEMFSFDDVDTIKKAILKFQANAERLETVAAVFSKAHDTALDLKRGRLERNQETFDVFYLFAIALFLMERMQFICSFATTFTYDHHGHFKPICNAVTKICQDEYEIHAMAGAYIIEHLSGTSHGLMAFNRLRETIVKMFHEVLYNELRHVPLLMEGRKEIFGVTIEDYWRWARFNATFIAEHLRIPTEFTPLHKNPLSFMKKYMNINSIQQSLQEEQGKAYLLTPVRRDDYGYEFDTTGL